MALLGLLPADFDLKNLYHQLQEQQAVFTTVKLMKFCGWGNVFGINENDTPTSYP